MHLLVLALLGCSDTAILARKSNMAARQEIVPLANTQTNATPHRNDKRAWKDLVGNVVANQVLFLAMASLTFMFVSPRGYTRFADPVPSGLDLMLTLVGIYATYEFLFYTGHRILHIRDLNIFGKRINLYTKYHHQHQYVDWDCACICVFYHRQLYSPLMWPFYEAIMYVCDVRGCTPDLPPASKLDLSLLLTLV